MKFELGEKVSFDRTLIKEKGVGSVFYVEDILPEPLDGVIVGFRTVSNYTVEEDSLFGGGFYTYAVPKEPYRRAWLIAYNLRRKVVTVPEYCIQKVEE